jgi:hypothetical protein
MLLYVAISHHGYGHLAQTAPVLNALAHLEPGLELIIRSTLPEAVVARRVAAPFRYIEAATDCNFVMHDALRIDLPASLSAYRAFHADWPARVAAEADDLTRLGVNAVFSDVGYLPLAAAQQAGMVNIALCSLNWADIFAHYLGEHPDAAVILAAMRRAYAGADAFLRPEPAMPMADLDNGIAIPPIALAGTKRRAELDRRLKLTPEERLVLIGLGGVPHPLPVNTWPVIPGVSWLLPDAWPAARPDMHHFSSAGLAYIDLLASVDALLTKPGYGSFVEAAHARVPVLYLPRPDWPETPYLVDWLTGRAPALEIDEARLRRGDMAQSLAALWAQPACSWGCSDGAETAARLIQAYLVN